MGLECELDYFRNSDLQCKEKHEIFMDCQKAFLKQRRVREEKEKIIDSDDKSD